MPSRAKKVNKQKPSDFLSKEKGTDIEKENVRSDTLLKEKKSDLSSIKLECGEINTEEPRKAPLSPQKQNLEQKAVGFWNKKLQDLELQKGLNNKETHSLYEFNGTDECRPNQKKKKSKLKAGGVSRKKKVAASKCNNLPPLYQNLLKNTKKPTASEKKIKQIHQTSLFREQLILNKEREQLADKGKKFTFSTGMPSLGVTSTPALNKDNLIGASNFLFLSPIIREDAESCSANYDSTPVKSKPFANPGQETDLQKISSRRVLRSGRVLNS